MKRQSTGFTLVELMVTVAVAAILIAVALPSFTDFIEKSRVKGAADDVVTLIAQARGGAVKRGRNVTVAFTSGWCVGANEAATPAVGDQFATSAACVCTTASNCTVDGRTLVVASTNYTGVTLGSPPSAFTFDGKNGSITPLPTTNPSLTLTSAGGYVLNVSVSPLGQTRVCVTGSSKSIMGYPQC